MVQREDVLADLQQLVELQCPQRQKGSKVPEGSQTSAFGPLLHPRRTKRILMTFNCVH
jgi:hypothetical protein